MNTIFLLQYIFIKFFRLPRNTHIADIMRILYTSDKDDKKLSLSISC